MKQKSKQISNSLFYTFFLSLFSKLISCGLISANPAISGSVPIISFSTGTSHLSILFGVTNGSYTASKVDIYNATTNLSTTAFVTSGEFMEIREPKTGNSASSYKYLLHNSNTMKTKLFSSNASQNLNTQLNMYPSQDVYFTNAAGSYLCYPAGTSPVYSTPTSINYYIYKQTSTTYTSNYLNFYHNYTKVDSKVIPSTGQILTFYYYYALNLSVTAKKLHRQSWSSFTITELRSIPVTSSSPGPFFGDVNSQYYCIINDKTFSMYYISNNTLKCSFTLSSFIYDAALTDSWLFVSLPNEIKQFNATSCTQLGNYSITGTVKLRVHGPPLNQLYYFESFSTTINTLSYTALPQPPPPPPPPPPSPSVPVQEQSGQLNHCFEQSSRQGCNIYCDFSCETCPLSPEICGICKQNLLKRQQIQDGRCILSIYIKILVITANTVDTFRSGSVQSLLCVLDGLQNYEYHKTNYSGIVKEIINIMNDIESMKWSLLPIQFLNQWIEKPYGTEIYNSLTNERFLNVERTNALIFETTKAFYLLSIPLNFVVFILLNRVFFCLKKFRVSAAFRLYSFGFQFFMITVTSNSSTICFLSAHYSKVLSSFSFYYKSLHCLSILLIGLFLITLVSIFFMSSYFCRKLSKYFLPNIYRVNFAFFYAFFKFSVQPLIESAMHVFLYENGEAQLISLACFEGFFFFFQIIVELNFGIFKQKFVFLCQACLQFCMFLLNILLLLVHYKLKTVQKSDEIISIVQSMIETLCFTMFGITCLPFVQLIITSLISLFYKKKITNDIWNWGEVYKKYQKKIKKKIENKKNIKEQKRGKTVKGGKNSSGKGQKLKRKQESVVKQGVKQKKTEEKQKKFATIQKINKILKRRQVKKEPTVKAGIKTKV